VALPSVAILRAKTIDSANPVIWQVASPMDRSGAVMTSDGWILFSQPGLSSFMPTAANSEVWIGGRRFVITKMVTDTLTNLVMVKVDGQNFSAVPFGNSEEARSGEIVFGLLDGERLLATSLTDTSSSLTTIYQAEEYNSNWTIDTNLGVTSAPIVNASGALIGFADSNLVTPLNHIVQSVLKDGYASYAGLGAQVVDINRVLNIDPALKMNQKEGALVTSLPKGPAKSSGVKMFDLITAIDGVPITSADPISIALKRYTAGSKIKLTIIRTANSSEIEVTLGDYADLIY
jgi:S1-C subfamily serine protease